MGSLVTKQVIYVAAHIRQVTLNREDETHIEELPKHFERTKIRGQSSTHLVVQSLLLTIWSMSKIILSKIKI